MRHAGDWAQQIVNNKAFAITTGLISSFAAWLDKLEQWLEIGITFFTFVLVAWNVHDRVKKALKKKKEKDSGDIDARGTTTGELE